MADKVKASNGFILASYRGLSANATAGFRDQLVKAGGSLFAVKKRMFLKIASEMKLEYELGELEGHIGIVLVGENFVSTSKAIFAFVEENKEAVKVIGGHFEGRKCSSSEVEQISKLPSLSEMRAQFLGLLEAPMSHVVGVFEAALSSVIYCLDNKAKKES
jgi:large subunit ribosomal protein L10